MDGRGVHRVKARRLRLASPTAAVGLAALTALLLGADVPLQAQIQSLSPSSAWELAFVVPFTLVGAIVARREARNPMGWLLLAISLVVVLSGVASDYAVFVYYYGHRGWPLGPLAVFFDTFNIATGLLVLPLVVLLFPDGRVGARWKWPLRGYYVMLAVSCASRASIAAVALQRRTPVWGGGGVIGANHPSGFATWTDVTKPILVPGVVVFAIASVTRLVLSYRASTGDRRQQLKWLGAGAATSIASVAVAVAAGSSAPTAVWVFIILGWAALPLGMGVGILKYHLYEIDRLVSRTISYAILTALLAGTFIGLIALTTDTLALSGRVGVAASTLAAAALFNPLRKRIQRLVDRRFNRARYDAEATVAAFTARLRDAVEIDAIRGDLLDAVNRAVEPTHASVWIKT